MTSASSARSCSAPARMKPGIGDAVASCARTFVASRGRNAVRTRWRARKGCMQALIGSIELRHGTLDRDAQLRVALPPIADGRREDAEQPNHLALDEWSALA